MHPTTASAWNWLQTFTQWDVARRLARPAWWQHGARPRSARRLGFEGLEPRIVLAPALDSVGTNDVKFKGDKSDDLYLQVSGGVLQWGATASSLTTVTDNSGQPFEVNSGTTITYTLGGSLKESGTLYVLGLDRGGIFKSDYNLVVQGDVTTDGEAVEFDADHDLTVNDSVTIDTTSATGDKAGSITLAATNQTKDPGIDIWNFVQTIVDGLSGEILQDASVTIGAGAVLHGGEISATATGGDNLVLEQAEDYPGAGQFLSLGLGWLNDFADLPISCVVKKSSAKVTVESGAQITATGDVDLESTAVSAAAGSAVFNVLMEHTPGIKNGAEKGGFAIGVSYAKPDAETTVSGSAVITSGGNVTITSEAESTSKMTASVTQYGGLHENVNPDNVQVALGSSVAYLTSKTTVGTGASITAAGTVDIEATGTKENKLYVYTASYGDGKVGLTGAVAMSNADVETKVDGTVSAGVAPAATSLTFNPSLAVDFATSSIRFDSDAGYTTGEAVIYNSGLGGAIPGLVSGHIYYAIVDPSDSEVLQLAATKAAAVNGTFVPFGPAYPTLSAAALTVPITSISAPDDTISFDYEPGFTEGQPVTYTPALGNYLGYNDSQGQLAGPLAGTYTVHIVHGTADANERYSLQLQDSGGQIVDLNDDPLFSTLAGQQLQVSSFDPLANQVTFDSDALTSLGVTLSNGQPLVYTQALNCHVTGLADGATYYAVVDPATPGVIQLANSLTQAQAADPSVQLAAPTLTWSNNGSPQTFSIDTVENSVNPDTDEPFNAVEFSSDPALTDGTPVTYHEVPGKPIGGLTDGATYYAYNETNPWFDATAPLYLLVLKSTASATAAPVTLATWQTLTDSSGDAYDIVGSDAVHNTVSILAADGTVPTVPTGAALTFTDAFGLSIGGLLPGRTYYAVVAPTQPFPDSLLLALADTYAEATAAAPTIVSLQQVLPLGAVDVSYLSGTQHTLDSVVSASLTIRASLDSTDILSCGPQVGGTATLSKMLTSSDLTFDPMAWKRFANDKWDIGSFDLKKAKGQSVSSWAGASAGAYLEATHTVLVEIGSHAVLGSTGNIDISSELTESTQPQVNAVVSKEKAAAGADGPKLSLGVGVLIALYDNTNRTIIDANARVDAGGELTVDAHTTYPWAWQILNPKDENGQGGFGHDQGNKVLGSLETVTDGMLGLDTLLCNSWVDVGIQGESTENAIAVSVSWLEFTNTTVAQIAEGAQINQDHARQNSAQAVAVTASTDFIQVGFVGLVYLDFTPGTLVKTLRSKDRLADFNNNNLAQVPSKEKSVGGSLGYVSLDNTTQALIGGLPPADGVTMNAPATGPTRINFGDNPVAEDGSPRTDDAGAAWGGLNVQATASVFYLTVAQGGGKSENVGVTGTAGVPEVTTTTTAQIAAGAIVTSNPGTTGDVTVRAEDTLNLITIAGAVLISGNKEVGVSSSVNTVTRKVSAVIGDLPGGTAPDYTYTATDSSAFHVGGAIDVAATADGVLVAAALAAAVTGSSVPQGQNNQGAAGDNVAKDSWGWGFSGDFTWVQLTDNVVAAVNDNGTFSCADAFTIHSTDDTLVVSGSGAMTFQKDSTAESSAGLAGSAAVITMDGTVQAVLAHADLTQASGLNISADRTNNLVSVAASGSGSFIGNATEVAGSVTVVKLDGATTEAQVNGATANLSGGATVQATDTNAVVSVAGSAALGGKSGFGGGVAVTELNTTTSATSATLTDSTISQTVGGFLLNANSSPTVVAVAAGLAVSRANTGVSVDLAAMVTVNQVGSHPSATVQGGSYTNDGTADADGLTVSAGDNAKIVAVGGEVSFEWKGEQQGSDATIGASVVVNTIDSTVEAYLADAAVTVNSGGDVVVQATSNPDLLAIAVGVGGAVSNGKFGFSLVGSGASNQMTGKSEALIEDGSVVQVGSGQVTLTAAETGSLEAIAGVISFSWLSSGAPSGGTPSAACGVSVALNTLGSEDDKYAVTAEIDGSTVTAVGPVNLTATATPTIAAGSGAGAFSYSTGGGSSSAGIAGAGAGSSNTLSTSVLAQISSSTVTTTGGDVSLDAHNTPTIKAIAGGVAIAGSKSNGGTGVAVTVGAAVAMNSLDQTTRAIIQSSLVSASGDVQLTANVPDSDNNQAPEIKAVAVGVAGSASLGNSANFGVAIGAFGSGASNDVASSTQALIQNCPGTDATNHVGVAAGGQVTLDAEDSSALSAKAAVVDVSIAATNATTGVSVAVDVSWAINTLGNSAADPYEVTAEIDNSNVTATHDVSLTADSSPAIEAGSGAGSGSFSGGGGDGSKVGIAGAGAASENTIYAKVEALISSSTVAASSGAVGLTATDGSSIQAVAGGVTMAGAKGAEGAGVAVSVGVAVAMNSLDQTTQAIIQGSTVTASGDVDLTATNSDTELKAVAIGVAGAMGTGSQRGFAVGLIGSGATNEVIRNTEALIRNYLSDDSPGVTITTAVTSQGGDVMLQSEDTSSKIEAYAGTASFSLMFQGAASVACGASAAQNVVGKDADHPNTVQAALYGATVQADGDVQLTASATPSIYAGTGAGAGSYTGGAGDSVGISGAGAGSGNTLVTQVEALISSSTVTTTHGDVSLVAEDTSTIEAIAGGIQLAGAKSDGIGVPVTIGAALAFNDIRSTTLAIIQGSTVKAAGAVRVDATNTATIEAITVGVAGTLGTGGDDAFTVAVGGAGSGSGNQVTNDTEALIRALNSVPSVVSSGTGQDVSLTAKEYVQIVAGAGSLALSVAWTGGGGTSAIGVSAAINQIGSEADPSIVKANIDQSQVCAGGSVTLNASTQPPDGEEESIKAITVAGGVVVGIGSKTTLAFPLAGAGSGNSITEDVEASITNCTGQLTDAQGQPVQDSAGQAVGAVYARTGDISLSAKDNSVILADGGGATLSVSVTDKLDIAAGVGAGYAENTITNTTTAAIDASHVTAGGQVSLKADSTATITAKPFGVGLAVGVSSEGGATAAGSGAAGYNTITNTIQAYIQDGSQVTAHGTWADAVQLSATDNSSSTCSGGAGSLGVQVGKGVALAVGAVIAKNTITNTIQAYIGCDPSATSGKTTCVPTGTDSTEVTSDGGVQVTASSDTAKAEALGVAVAVTVAIADIWESGAGSGSGASSTNQITNTVTAAIRNGSTVHAHGTTTLDKDGKTDAGSTLLVQAGSTPVINARVGSGSGSVGWFGGSVGVSLADNTVNNTVQAFLDSATVTTHGQKIDVTAQSTNNITSKAVATSLSVSVGAAGAGGSAHATDTTQTRAYVGGDGAQVRTNFDGTGATSSYGALNISATNTGGTISAETDGGSGGVGSVGVFLATATVGDQPIANSNKLNPSTSASLSGNVTLQVGNLTVSAAGVQDVSTRTIAVVLGGLVGSGCSSTTTVADTVQADLATTSSLTGSAVNGSVSITATSADTGKSEADGGLLGAIGASGNLAHSTVKPTVTAYVADGVELDNSATSHDVTVSATATNVATSNAFGVVADPGIGVDVSEAKPTASATVSAYVGHATLTVGGDLTISAGSTDTATANANASAGAVLEGDGAVADATITPSVQAYVGNTQGGADLTAKGAVGITATETPYADAEAFGVTVGLLVAVGVIKSQATLSDTGTVSGYLAGNSSVSAQSLTITATQQPQPGQSQTANASSTAGSGGLLTGADGAKSEAQAGGSVQAYTGNSVTLPAGDITIQATNQTLQKAYANGIGVGVVLGAGKMTAKAGSDVTTAATLGKLADQGMSPGGAGDLNVRATGSDNNTAIATGGSGGIVSGDSADAETSDSSTVTAALSGGTIYAGTVTVSATNTSEFAPNANSTNGAVVGGSGANAKNTQSTSATVTVADSTKIIATSSVTIAAQNSWEETTDGDSASAGAGGVVNGNAVESQATINDSSTPSASVTLGDSVQIKSGTLAKRGGIVLSASSSLQDSDRVSIDTGGVVDGGGAESKVTATLTNAVTIGAHNVLQSSGDITAGTNLAVNASTDAYDHVGGVVAGAGATAQTTVTGNQTVNVGSGTEISALGDIALTPGGDSSGVSLTNLIGSSYAYAYAEALTGFATSYTANTDLTSRTTLAISDGATITSGQNVTLGAYPGNNSAAQLAESQSSFIFIPIRPDPKDDPGTITTTSVVTLNGTIQSGMYRQLEITIPANGSGFSPSLQVNSDAAVTLPDSSAFSGAGAVLTPVTPATADFDAGSQKAPFFPFQAVYVPNWDVTAATKALVPNTSTQALLTSAISSTTVGALALHGLSASGGEVIINAASLSGTASITVYVPQITVTNQSPDYLLLDGIAIPDNPHVGTVVFTGSSTSAAATAAGMTLREDGLTQTPSVTIDQTYHPATKPGPALFVTAPIQNTGGNVSVVNDYGAYVQLAPITAASISVSAPNGAAIIYQPDDPYSVGGGPEYQWPAAANTPFFTPGSTSGGWNANLAATAAADAIYGGSNFGSDGDFMKYALYGTAPNTDNSTGTSHIYFGYPQPYTGLNNGCGNFSDTQDKAITWSSLGSNYTRYGGYYQIGSGGSQDKNACGKGSGIDPYPQGNLPDVVHNQQVSATSGTNLASPSASGLLGAKIFIDASILDVNSPITAGQVTATAIQLTQDLGATLRQYRADYLNHLQSNPLYDIPSPDPNNPGIGATYDAQANQITIASYSIGSGEVTVMLHGQIVSTNSTKITLQGGAGPNTVRNDTGIPVVVKGIASGSSTVTGRVDINDTNQHLQTLYVYTPGQPIQIYTGGVGETLGTGTFTTAAGTSVSYQPPSGTRYQWTNTATITRTVSNDTNVGQWKFPAVTDPSTHVTTPASTDVTNNPYLAAGQTVIAGSTSDPVFKESLSATENSRWSYGKQFNSEASAAYDFGANTVWNFYYPNSLTLTTTSSVKADYAIAIDFSGLAPGSLSINSNAAVSLDGPIQLAGSTTISAQGSITNTANAAIESTNLSLYASGSIGRPTQPLSASLSPGSVLNALGDNQGVYIDLNSGASIGQVAAQGTSVNGFNGDGTGWTVNNSNITSTPITGDVLTLTDNHGGEARSVWLNTPVSTNSFTARFTYQAGPSSQTPNSLADGMAMVFQNQGLNALGGAGGSLGYRGITGQTAAYEINIYNGLTKGTQFVTDNTTGTYTTTGSVDMASGDSIDVELTYDATAKTFTETLTDQTTHAIYTLAYANIDLAAILGSSTALVGFTGGTGGVASTQIIRSFSFISASTHGDVVISAAGNLSAAAGQPSGTVNITGNNITLTSSAGSVGSSDSPLILQATGTELANRSVLGGVVTAHALGDIHLVQNTGDLLAGSIVSQAGDVSLAAPHGSLYDAGRWNTAALTLARARQFWQTHHLNDLPAAQLATQQEVVAFENQIERAYQQYWQLLHSGTVQQDGSYTLGFADPTPEQVAQTQAYANFTYQQLLGFFQANLPAGWLNLPDFQTYNPNYQNTPEIVANYQEYWQLLNHGTVANGLYTLAPAAVPQFSVQAATAFFSAQAGAAATPPTSSPSPAQVQDYTANLYQQTVTFFDANLPAGWRQEPDFVSYNASYQYAATAAQVLVLTHAVRTENQLRTYVNSSALEPAGGAPDSLPTQSIQGATVTLTAGGSLGRAGTPVVIPLANLQSGILTAEQAAVLAQADRPGEVLLQGTDALGQTVTFLYGQQPAGVTVTGIQVSVTRPLFVSVAPAGVLNATAQSDINLSQISGDLGVGQVSSASGSVQLAAAGSIRKATQQAVGDEPAARFNWETSTGQVHIYQRTFSGATLPTTFSFYASTTVNYSVTPLLFSVVNGTYQLAATYQPIAATQVGLNSHTLTLSQGSPTSSGAYAFGYIDQGPAPSLGSVGAFAASQDIGSPGQTGAASYDPAAQTYTVAGGGADIWNTGDQFRYVYTSVSGDESIVAQMVSQDNTSGWAKAGVMFRDGTAANAAYALVAATPANGVAFQWRSSTGAQAQNVNLAGLHAPVWVKLVRAGNIFTGYYSADGSTWTQIGTPQPIAMAAPTKGLAVTAGNNRQICHVVFTHVAVTVQDVVGSFATSQDIGSPGQTGAASYDAASQTYTVQGGGYDIWNASDQFRYASSSVSGDASIVAQVASLDNTSGWAKAGVMFRDGTAANAAYALMAVTPSAGLAFQWRTSAGAQAQYAPGADLSAPAWVKLMRSGDTFTAYSSTDGSTWVQVGTPQTIPMTAPTRGLAVTAHDNTRLGTATFRGVSVSGAIPFDANGSNLWLVTTSLSASGTNLALGQVFSDSGSGTALQDLGRSYSAQVVLPVLNTLIAWVEDAIPAGATAGFDGGDAWTWVSSPTPYSGQLAHQSKLASGTHQHFFYNATQTLAVNQGDALYAYVYLDPANVPSEVVLQWNVNGSWEHRAYWGANQIAWGTNGTASLQYMGPLPPAGTWVRLQVPASAVGLEGTTVSGMAFSLYGGRATWDQAGKLTSLVSGHDITLTSSAADGSVGTSSTPIHIALTGTTPGVLNASAQTGVYVNALAGDLHVGRVSSAGGTASLSAAGSILAGTSGSQPNVTAPSLSLTAAGGSSGLASDPLRIAVGTGLLNVSAQTGIYVNKTQGTLYIGTVTSTLHDIVLDPPGPGQSIVLGSNSVVSAPQGHVTLLAHDDVTLAAGSVVRGLTITLQGGFSATPGLSADSRLTLAGILDAASILILGGSGNDTVWLGSDGTSPGSLDRIRGRIEFRGGGGADEINLDDRAAVDGSGQPLRAGYAITPTQVGNNPGAGFLSRIFAGLTYDASVARLHVLGSAGSGVFHVKPSTTTDYTVDGSPDAGNSLVLDKTGTLGATLKDLLQGGQVVPGAGTWTFSGLLHAIQFTGMQSLRDLTLGAVGQAPVLLQAPLTDATFTVTYQGFTSLDLSHLIGNQNAILVTGPGGYSQRAHFISVTPSSDGTSQIATYSLPAPGDAWDKTDNGQYTILIAPDQIRDSLGNTLPAREVGSLWVNIAWIWLTSTLQAPGQYRLDVSNAVPGGVVVFAYGTQAGQYPLNNAGVTLGVADPVFLAQVVTPLSGHIQALFHVPAGLAGRTLTFQAFQQAPDPHISLLVSELVSSTPMAPLVSSIGPDGPALTNAGTVVFTVTFRQAVSGLSAADLALSPTAGVTGARISSVRGSDTTYTVTVETGTGDGKLGLNLKDETGLAAATGIDPTLTRNGLFEGEAYTLHKTPEDVNLDFVVTPLDVLSLIHVVNGNSGAFVPDGSVGPRSSCYDVNGDGWVMPLDVLLVITYLNQRSLATAEGESAPHPNPLPEVPGRGSYFLAAGEGKAAAADGLPSPIEWLATAPATGVFAANTPTPEIRNATTMILRAVSEPLWSPPPLSSKISSDSRLAVLTQAQRTLPQRSASNDAFGGDWDATSGELEDALAEIAGEVGSSWQHPADGYARLRPMPQS